MDGLDDAEGRVCRSDDAVLDPREARARHHERTAPSAGLLYLRALSAEEEAWIGSMVGRVARVYRVDPDDLLQDLRVSLLECDSIEAGRTEVRGWLKRRALWRAADLLRREKPCSQTESLDEETPDKPAKELSALLADWDRERLEALDLRRDEAQVVLLVLWGIDVSLRDFAQMVKRSYSKTRQDKVRGLRKIEDLFDLEPEERAAFVAVREYGSTVAAAARLDLPECELRQLISHAEFKINRALGRHERAPGRRDEDDSDAR